MFYPLLGSKHSSRAQSFIYFSRNSSDKISWAVFHEEVTAFITSFAFVETEFVN